MLVPAESRRFFEPCGTSGLLLCHISYWIWKTMPFLLMAIGTCGNILSMVVLSRKRLRQISTSVYLIFLACSDLTLLWTAVLREILIFVFRFDIHSVSNFHCATIYWLLYLSSSVSVWILVLLTVERLLFTKFPVFAKRHMNRKNAFITCTVTVVIMAIVGSHVFFGQRIREIKIGANVTTLKCIPSGDSYSRFAVTIWPYLMFVVYNFLPMVIIFSGNILIFFSLRRQRKTMAHHQTIHPQFPVVSEKSDKEARAARLLFILCFFFMITTTPFMIFGIVYSNIYKDLDDEQFAGIQLTYAIIKILIWSNYTFNFFFYFMNGTLFKREWESLIREIRSRLCESFRSNRVESTGETVTMTVQHAVATNDTGVV